MSRTRPQLTARRGSILHIIVGDYIESALPVGSEHIAKAHPLGVSSATIRNDMAALEEDGFITHPHTSAGRIPSDKGYRHYVETLMATSGLPPTVQHQWRARLAAIEGELDRWMELAASLLAQLVEAVAVVTAPVAPAARFRHVELVALQEFALLVVLVLQEARVKQHLLHLEQKIQQEELASLSQRLSALYAGMTSHEIAQVPPATGMPDHVARAVVKLMEAEDQRTAHEIQMTGLRHLLGQPEFNSTNRLSALVEMADDRDQMGRMLPRLAQQPDVNVHIGSEIPDSRLQDFALVLAPYGVPGQYAGTLGVLGPTRMRYTQAIAAVRLLSGIMSTRVTEQLA